MVYTPALGQAAIDATIALQRSPHVHYDWGVDLVDMSGNVLDSLETIYEPSSPPKVSRQMDAPNSPGTFEMSTERSLTWGRDLVAPYMLLSSRSYRGGEPVRFPRGVYIATSPERKLRTRNSDQHVICYDKMYLLQSNSGATFSANAGTTYADAVATMLDTAGIVGAKVSGHLSSDVVRYPADWYAKTVPSGSDMIFANDDSNSYTFLDIVNALLKASGCRPLFTDPLGFFTVVTLPVSSKSKPLWTIDREPSSLYDGTVVRDSAVFQNDLWGVPNRIRYVQNGLTFDPIEGSGQFTINNSTSDSMHYRSPSDQQTIGRVITDVRRFDASGQADLVKQAEKDYEDIFADVERVVLDTATWPCAWHYDVWLYKDVSLDRVPMRKVLTKSWDQPLNGDPMHWTTSVVADS